MVQGQGHKGQGRGSKVVGQVHQGQSQCRRVKVKVVWEVLYPIDSREVRQAGIFIGIKVNRFLVTLQTDRRTDGQVCIMRPTMHEPRWTQKPANLYKQVILHYQITDWQD